MSCIDGVPDSYDKNIDITTFIIQNVIMFIMSYVGRKCIASTDA